MTARRRANFYLDEDLLAGLKELKARVGIPESEAVRRAVAEYLTGHSSRLTPSADVKRASRKRGLHDRPKNRR